MAITKCPCGKEPSFGYEKDNKRICCKSCRKEGMIDLKNRKYLCKCGKNPAYGFLKDDKIVCCASCKLPGMINLKIKLRCKCGKIPTFGEKDKEPTHCKDCKTDEMIDLKHSKCLCGAVRPSFGYENHSAVCCKDCKTDEMINIVNLTMLCSCGTRCTFGYKEDREKTACLNCKKDGMIDLAHKMCINCKDWIDPHRGASKYDDYCYRCFSYLFPLDKRLDRNYKYWEQKIKQFINDNFEDFKHDKILEYGGCDCLHRRRIDHRCLINNTILAIETDEKKHKRYNEQDEMNRYNDLCSYFTCKWIFIRFNPDSYYINKDNDRDDPKLEDRLILLKKEIKKQKKRIRKDKNKDLIEIIYLFYDEN